MTAMRRSAIIGTLMVLGLARPAAAAAATAYVSNEKGNTISVIDTDKWQVVKTIKVGELPWGIAIARQ